MNFYTSDKNLQRILKNSLEPDFFAFADKELTLFGKKCANEIDQRAVHTDREGQPKLIKYNRSGDDVSEIWVNEGYLKTVEETYKTGIVGYVHKEIPALKRQGNYLYSYAQGYLLSQAEIGFYCPVTLTMATAFLFDHYADESLKKRFLPHVISTGELPLYEGATFLSERQGGSDVGANVVQAVKSGDHYKLYGEKYFGSNSGMCGVTTVLARIEGAKEGAKGLTLFAVPWQKEDGTLNGITIRRLKDKLGVRAVPSAEVEFDGADAYVIGDPSKGIYYMMEALNLSRVCNAVASIGIMRRAYTEAKNYATDREAFGKKLIEYPMVQDTLTKLAVKQEIETSAIFKIISLFDKVMKVQSKATKEEILLNRLLIAVFKKETADQSIHFSHEAIEMLGGNGYMEDFVTPRLLRDAQVLTVWEGPANILGLEALRLISKYNAHKLFIADIKRSLQALPESLKQWTDTVQEKVIELEQFISSMLAASEDHQTFHSKKILKCMSDIYESVVALEQAVTDERSHKVMQVFLEQTWQYQLFDEKMITVEFFKEIVRS